MRKRKSQQMIVLSVSVTPELKAAIRARSAELGISRSALVRWAVAAFLGLTVDGKRSVEDG